jgi:prepilin-type N-terminal cleavage/methylation domain-containing protein
MQQTSPVVTVVVNTDHSPERVVPGFTLLEVLLVLSILAIVIGFVQLNMSHSSNTHAIEQDRQDLQYFVTHAQQQARRDHAFRLLVGQPSGMIVYDIIIDPDLPAQLMFEPFSEWAVTTNTTLSWQPLGAQPSHLSAPVAPLLSLIKSDGTLEPSWRVEMNATGSDTLRIFSDGLNPPVIEHWHDHE